MYTLVRLDKSPLISVLMLIDALRSGLDLVLYNVKENSKIYVHHGHTTGWQVDNAINSTFENIALVKDLLRSPIPVSKICDLLGIKEKAVRNRISTFQCGASRDQSSLRSTSFDIPVGSQPGSPLVLRCRKMVLSGNYDMLAELLTGSVYQLKKNIAELTKDLAPPTPDDADRIYTSSQLLGILLGFVLHTIPNNDGYTKSRTYAGAYFSPYTRADYYFPQASYTPVNTEKPPIRFENGGINTEVSIQKGLRAMTWNPNISDSCFLESKHVDAIIPRVSFGTSSYINEAGQFPLCEPIKTPAGTVLTSYKDTVNCALVMHEEGIEYGMHLRVLSLSSRQEELQLIADNFYSSIIKSTPIRPRSNVGLGGTRKAFRHIDRDYKKLNSELPNVIGDLVSYFKIKDSASKGHAPSIDANARLNRSPFFLSSVRLRNILETNRASTATLEKHKSLRSEIEESIRSLEDRLATEKLRLKELETMIGALATTLKTKEDEALALSTECENQFKEVKAILEENTVFNLGSLNGMLRECNIFNTSIEKVRFDRGAISYDEASKSYKLEFGTGKVVDLPTPSTIFATFYLAQLMTVELVITEPFINSYRNDAGKCPTDWAYVLPPMKFKYDLNSGPGIAFFGNQTTLSYGPDDRAGLAGRMRVHPHTMPLTPDVGNLSGLVSISYPGPSHYAINGSVCCGNLGTFLQKSLGSNNIPTSIRSSLGWLSSNAGSGDSWSRETKEMSIKTTLHSLLAVSSPLKNLSTEDLFFSKDGTNLLIVFEDRIASYFEKFVEQFQGELPEQIAVSKKYLTYSIPVSAIPQIDGKMYVNEALILSYKPVVSSTKRLRSISSADKIPSGSFDRSLIDGYLSISAPAVKQEEITCSPS